MSTRFFQKLITALVENNRSILEELDLTARDFAAYLMWQQTNVEQFETEEKLRRIEYFTLEGFTVPAQLEPSLAELISVTERLGAVQFSDCIIKANHLDSTSDEGPASFFFDRCTFKSDWHAQGLLAIDQVTSVLHRRCIFEQNVTVRGGMSCYGKHAPSSAPASVFADCEFQGDLIFDEARLAAPAFLDSPPGLDLQPKAINSVRIIDSYFEEQFLLNNCAIGLLKLENSDFAGKVELKSNVIKTFSSDNTNFRKLTDFYRSRFGQFTLSKGILSDFVAFEQCEFGIQALLQTLQQPTMAVSFQYATFMSFVTFRDSTFHQGLDLRNSNRKELPNFIGCNFPLDGEYKTDRETFRIIKHSFDAVGNHVEGSAFFAKEMRAYRRELQCTDQYANRFLLACNEVMSNFGESYWRPIGWIALCASIFAGIQYGHQHNWLYHLFPQGNEAMALIATLLNAMATSLKIFKPIMISGMEFVSLLFAVLFSVLIWLTIVAIKRHTRR